MNKTECQVGLTTDLVFFYYPKKIFYFCIAIINYRNTIIIKDEKEIDSFMEERDRYASRKDR